VADCEGDIQEWFLDAMGRAPYERAEFLIRAKCNRRRAQGARHDDLWDEMAAARPLGKSTFKLSRQADRPPRRVTLAVTARPVTFQGARRPGGRLPPVQVWAVYARERKPPKGEEPIEWLLLTSVSVESFAAACLVRQGYRARGEVELFFRVLKQGGQIARLRLATDQRLLNAIAIYLLIAWRIHTITMMARAYPDASGEVVFEPCEWQTIYNDAVPPPPSCPTASPAGDGPRLSATGWFLSSHWRRRAREQIHLARVSTVTRIYLRSRNVPRRQGFLDVYNDERLALARTCESCQM